MSYHFLGVIASYIRIMAGEGSIVWHSMALSLEVVVAFLLSLART